MTKQVKRPAYDNGGMTKKQFLKLSGLCWDYNKRHETRKVQITQSLDNDHLSVSLFNFPDWENLSCLWHKNTPYDLPIILDELSRGLKKPLTEEDLK
jgi:hypothetical protein